MKIIHKPRANEFLNLVLPVHGKREQPPALELDEIRAWIIH
jgi:hypothetical protein